MWWAVLCLLLILVLFTEQRNMFLRGELRSIKMQRDLLLEAVEIMNRTLKDQK